MKIIEKQCIVCKKIVEYTHKSKPKECPYCKDIYWDKPNDERELFLLQEKYLKNGRKKEDLGLMYNRLLSYAENIIKYKLKNKKILSEEEFYDKSNDIAIAIVERYLKYPDKKISYSFGGMMLRIANGILYGKRKEDQAISLNQEAYENKEVIEVLDHVSDQEEQHRYFSEEDPTNDSINNLYDLGININLIISSIYKKVYKKKSSQNLLFLIGLNHFLSSNKENFIRNFNNIIFNSTKRNIEQSKLAIRNFLLDKEL